jgi:hypothetical protein
MDATFQIRSEEIDVTFRSTASEASDSVFRNRSEAGVKFWTFVGIKNASWTCQRGATSRTARSYTSHGAMPCVLLNISGKGEQWNTCRTHRKWHRSEPTVHERVNNRNSLAARRKSEDTDQHSESTVSEQCEDRRKAARREYE